MINEKQNVTKTYLAYELNLVNSHKNIPFSNVTNDDLAKINKEYGDHVIFSKEIFNSKCKIKIDEVGIFCKIIGSWNVVVIGPNLTNIEEFMRKLFVIINDNRSNQLTYGEIGNDNAPTTITTNKINVNSNLDQEAVIQNAIKQFGNSSVIFKNQGNVTINVSNQDNSNSNRINNTNDQGNIEFYSKKHRSTQEIVKKLLIESVPAITLSIFSIIITI